MCEECSRPHSADVIPPEDEFQTSLFAALERDTTRIGLAILLVAMGAFGFVMGWIAALIGVWMQ